MFSACTDTTVEYGAIALVHKAAQQSQNKHDCKHHVLQP